MSYMWCFDSRCSRHVTGKNDYLIDYAESRSESFTFGDRVINNVVDFGTLNVESMPKVLNVLHVEGIKVNLIIINDNDLHVHFDKRRYYVLKENEKCIITGTRTSDNCYQINIVVDMISMNLSMHDMELWHRKLDHVNYKLLYKLGHIGIIRD